VGSRLHGISVWISPYPPISRRLFAQAYALPIRRMACSHNCVVFPLRLMLRNDAWDGLPTPIRLVSSSDEEFPEAILEGLDDFVGEVILPVAGDPLALMACDVLLTRLATRAHLKPICEQHFPKFLPAHRKSAVSQQNLPQYFLIMPEYVLVL